MDATEKQMFEVIRSHCYVLVPEPTYESGLVCWRRKPEWNGPVACLQRVKWHEKSCSRVLRFVRSFGKSSPKF